MIARQKEKKQRDQRHRGKARDSHQDAKNQKLDETIKTTVTTTEPREREAW